MSRVADGHFRRKREAPLILRGSTSQFRGHPRIWAKRASGPVQISLRPRARCRPANRYALFSQTVMCLVLSLVNGSRFQPLQRSRKFIPASRAIRSSSDGHT